MSLSVASHSAWSAEVERFSFERPSSKERPEVPVELSSLELVSALCRGTRKVWLLTFRSCGSDSAFLGPLAGLDLVDLG